VWKKSKISKRIFKHCSDDSNEVVDNDDNAWYSKSTKCGITCSKCHNWVHNSCVGVKSDDDKAVHDSSQSVS